MEEFFRKKCSLLKCTKTLIPNVNITRHFVNFYPIKQYILCIVACPSPRTQPPGDSIVWIYRKAIGPALSHSVMPSNGRCSVDENFYWNFVRQHIQSLNWTPPPPRVCLIIPIAPKNCISICQAPRGPLLARSTSRLSFPYKNTSHNIHISHEKFQHRHR